MTTYVRVLKKACARKKKFLDVLKAKHIEVLITLGAGDIDNYVPGICDLLSRRMVPSDN